MVKLPLKINRGRYAVKNLSAKQYRTELVEEIILLKISSREEFSQNFVGGIKK